MITPRNLIHLVKHNIFFERFGLPEVKDENISKNILKRYLTNNPVMIDCGAHYGSDSVKLNKILGGFVHAFEPVPNIYEMLCKKTQSHPNIKTYKLALSNKTGRDFFFVSDGASDASSSLLQPKDHLKDHSTTTFEKKIEVETITLDDWAEKFRVSKIDLLWLDMQGFEMQMLQASTTILPTVKVIHSEVSMKETYSGVPLYSEYKKFLESVGFKAVIEAIPAGYDMGNVLFIRQ